MKTRRTDTVTRVDVRIPNELYNQIQAIAIAQFNAKIHHRSGKPEISPTILELIKIGIAHLESTLPATDETEDLELRERIRDLDRRLKCVESKLSRVPSGIVQAESEPLSVEGLSDSELGRLINLSSALIYRYRLEGKAHQGVVERLKDWKVRGDRWVKKSDR